MMLPTTQLQRYWLIGLIAFLLFFSTNGFTHGVDANTERFLLTNQGTAIGAFLYIGAKHMVTGYDHLLWLRFRLAIARRLRT